MIKETGAKNIAKDKVDLWQITEELDKGGIYNEVDGWFLKFDIAPSIVEYGIESHYATVLPFKNSRERVFWGGTSLMDFSIKAYLSVAYASRRVLNGSEFGGGSELNIFSGITNTSRASDDKSKSDARKHIEKLKEKEKEAYDHCEKQLKYIQSCMYRNESEDDTPNLIVFVASIMTEAKLKAVQVISKRANGLKTVLYELMLTFQEIHDQNEFSRHSVQLTTERLDIHDKRFMDTRGLDIPTEVSTGSASNNATTIDVANDKNNNAWNTGRSEILPSLYSVEYMEKLGTTINKK